METLHGNSQSGLNIFYNLFNKLISRHFPDSFANSRQSRYTWEQYKFENCQPFRGKYYTFYMCM